MTLVERKRHNSTGDEDEHTYIRLSATRRQLPIYEVRSKLLSKFGKHETCIVIGETGSGKTTQIPQPRRVAAISIAQRVATEMNTEVGDLVGYNVRFEDMTSEDTYVKYMTDGMLLRESMVDPMLKKYSVVILDEAHERTIHTDVLFAVVKRAQKARRNQYCTLKIIVMSATMDVDLFSNYFNGAPVLYVEGRQFPVKIFYAKEFQEDYKFSCISSALQIHRDELPNEDILIFLTGQEEIEDASRQLRAIIPALDTNLPTLMILPLYSALPSYLQMKVFKPTPKGFRKIILSTNLAETSVTIQGIKHVIDSGMVKQKVYNTGIDRLSVCRVSKAQAWQRTGRAGRHQPGVCYRLYTEAAFDDARLYPNSTVPEILRCNLGGALLQIISLGIRDVHKFDFIDKPSKSNIDDALNQLRYLGAITDDEDNDEIVLSETGIKMSQFPLDPKFSKVILVASKTNCLKEVLGIVSVLSTDSIINIPSDEKRRSEAEAIRRKFHSADGDHFTKLNIYQNFIAINDPKWCHENFLTSRNLVQARKIFKQLKEICLRQNLPIESCGKDTESIQRCFLAGFYTNIAELGYEGKYKTINSGQVVHIHPSSCLFGSKPPCVVFNELIQTSKRYMRDIIVVEPDWIKEYMPSIVKGRNKSSD